MWYVLKKNSSLFRHVTGKTFLSAGPQILHQQGQPSFWLIHGPPLPSQFSMEDGNTTEPPIVPVPWLTHLFPCFLLFDITYSESLCNSIACKFCFPVIRHVNFHDSNHWLCVRIYLCRFVVRQRPWGYRHVSSYCIISACTLAPSTIPFRAIIL